MLSALELPALDPTVLFEWCRISYGTELLAAAVADFQLFPRLAGGPKSFDELRGELGLAERAANVLFTAMRAMKLLDRDAEGRLALTEMARQHLLPDAPFYMGDYLGLAATNPGTRLMVERLRTNRPAGASKPDEGAAFIFRAGIDSAMEMERSARHLTLSLAGRAKIVAPYLARAVDLGDRKLLLDIGGGSGIYAIALLQKYPGLRAIVWDRPEVLKVAREFAAEYGVADRLDCMTGDMFADPMPAGVDVMLLSNILHDWDVPECKAILERCHTALPTRGEVLIHDAFLDDDLGGPLNLALYSAALFSLTEGRAYSAHEYREWLLAAGFTPGPTTATMVHCGVMRGEKS